MKKDLKAEMEGKSVLIRGHVHMICNDSKSSLLIIRESGYSVGCVMAKKEGAMSEQMISCALGLSRKSFVEIEGIVSHPERQIKNCTQEVEILIEEIYCVSRSVGTLPFNVDSGENEIGEGSQDTLLDHRVIGLRTDVNQAIFRIMDKLESISRQFLRSEDFKGIHTPKLVGASNEGGAKVFRLDYKGKQICLAQSPQLHKQLSIIGDLKRVFEVGPMFRAENSFTHKHLCEFTALDVEMEIKENYCEVMDIVDRLFVAIFDGLNEICQEELEAIGKQNPFSPLKYLRKTPMLTFDEGVQMLKDDGVKIDPYGVLNTETERKLGQLVFEKYGTEVYILHRNRLKFRPFTTMPWYDDPSYSCSFDMFIRGKKYFLIQYAIQ